MWGSPCIAHRATSSRSSSSPLDLARTLDFYVRGLGFAIVREDDYVELRRGRITIGLLAAEALPADHYFEQALLRRRHGIGLEIILSVLDVDEAYEQATEAGIRVVSRLQAQPWGRRDFRAVDPDGCYVRVTSFS